VLILVAGRRLGCGRRLREALSKAGHTVEYVANRNNVLAACRRLDPDLLVVQPDISHLNGIDVCAQIRRYSGVPIVLLACDGDLDTLVPALQAGAKGCFKPSLPTREFTPRRAMLNRWNIVKVERSEVGDLRLDRSAYRAIVNGHAMYLRPLAYRLLAALVSEAGEVITRERLARMAWNRNVDMRKLACQIAVLRRKLRGAHVRIDTQRGVGYRLVVVGNNSSETANSSSVNQR
jgi:DNA-binding response OmpR family regulator